MNLFLTGSAIALVMAAIVLFGWYRDRVDRHTYEETLDDDARGRLRGWLSMGATWREFRDMENKNGPA